VIKIIFGTKNSKEMKRENLKIYSLGRNYRTNLFGKRRATAQAWSI
jgi:hypothetical protein